MVDCLLEMVGLSRGENVSSELSSADRRLTVSQKKAILNSYQRGVTTYASIAQQHGLSAVNLRQMSFRLRRGKNLREKLGRGRKLDSESVAALDWKFAAHPEWTRADIFNEIALQIKETWFREHGIALGSAVTDEVLANIKVSRRTIGRYARKYCTSTSFG